MAVQIEFVETSAKRAEMAEQILRSLPEWFALESALQNYVDQVRDLEMLRAFDESGDTLGMLALRYQSAVNAEIFVMGVRPEWHGKGIGKKLAICAERVAREAGCKFLTVKTLSPKKANLAYERTRKFYDSLGFVAFEEFADLWGSANPCLLMIKLL